MTTSRGYGWKPSLPDVRNFRLHFGDSPEIAASVDLRTSGFMPPVWDQGQIGSCTAHGSGAAYSYDLAKQGEAEGFQPSRLFVYYGARTIEGTVSQDSGATITDAIKALNRYGCPPETDWTYDITKFDVKPPQKAFDDGALREAVKYAQVPQTAADMKACLTGGLPIVIGFTVYDSFESQAVADTGDVPMPQATENILGGHCVLVVGYTVRDGQPVWICRNSWGTTWGDKGYFYFPEQYLLNPNLASDFWTVQSVSSPSPAPTPTPSPTPVPVTSADDKALWSAVKVWSASRHSGTTKTVATALKKWAAAKGLS